MPRMTIAAYGWVVFAGVLLLMLGRADDRRDARSPSRS
jgi:hypothetical protein